jgi:hypothetical protein
VQNEVSILGRKLDMKHLFLETIKDHPWESASCAAIFGWLLSRIPARKKRVYIDSFSQKSVKRRDTGPRRELWREVWQFFKPMIAAYLAKLLVEHAKAPEVSDLDLKWKDRGSAKDISG